MDHLSLGRLVAAVISAIAIFFAFGSIFLLAGPANSQSIVPTYPELNVEKAYPAIFCETKQAVLDIERFGKQTATGQLTTEQYYDKVEKYTDICNSGLLVTTLTKEIGRYTGRSMDGNNLTFGVFESTSGMFVITAIGAPEQES